MILLLLIGFMSSFLIASPSPIKSVPSFPNIDGLAIVAGLGILNKDREKTDTSLQIIDGKPVLHHPPPSPSWEVLYPDRCTIPAFPMGVNDAVAMATSDTILVCGGKDKNSNSLQTCHSLQAGAWSPAPPMLESRTNAAELMTENGWLVTGGSDNSGQFLDSMEMYRDGTWTKLPSRLPEAAVGHCLVQVNATTVFVTGGYIKHPSGSGLTYSYQANMFNVETGEWSRVENMRQDRAWHECFKMGDSVVVAGGLIYGTARFVEVFDLATERWRNERDLPEAVDKAGSVNVGDDVMVIGAGEDDNKILRFMWIDGELRVTRPIEKYSTLRQGRTGGVVLRVNRKLLNCQ